ncbi:MAG: glycosyltransferase family 4 protein [Prevotella sp.]|nr:glycosyltransferase family 4 protein [Prevotella sp.]
MKILWITNALLPEATAKICGTKELKGTGGWVTSLAMNICKHDDIHLYVAALSPLVKKITTVQGESITHFAIPSVGDTTYHAYYEEAYQNIFQQINPDVVHIHGTEYPHSLAALRACGADKTIVSLQGVVSSIASYYMGGISTSEARRNITLRGLLRPSLMQEQKEMAQRGEYEKQLFRECRYIMGRTAWDRAQVLTINPQITYFHGGEILRTEFYEGKWDYNKCVPHTIFASQAGYPLKGLHKIISALGTVIKQYPDLQLRVAGRDITFNKGTWKDKLRISTYGKIIKGLIKKHNLTGHVIFTGPLDAEEMKQEYLRSNVFICPSSIENSPNSIAEAQILGVPVLASQVGGIPDMMQGDEEHLYRFEEIEMLAHKIVQLFEKQDEIDTEPMRQVALKRHNPEKIIEEFIDTYKAVMDKH